jgi:hypothetical protein
MPQQLALIAHLLRRQPDFPPPVNSSVFDRRLFIPKLAEQIGVDLVALGDPASRASAGHLAA